MDKDLLKLLKELNGVIEDITKEYKSETKGNFKKALDKAFEEKASISIEKFEDGKAETHIEGSTLAILVTLAGLEKSILEHTKIPTPIWEAIKDTVGTRDNKEAE